MSTDIPISEFDKESVSSRVTTSGPQIENGNVGVSVLDILIMVADRKRSVFLVTAALTLASLLLSFLLPPRYTAGVAILPPQQGSSAAAVLAGQLGNASIASLAGGALGLKNPSDMFVGMLKSRTIEDAMVHHFGLMQEYHKRYLSDARKVFEKRVGIDDSGKDGLIHVTVWDRDPNRAAELANGYVDQLQDLSEHLAITEASQRRLFFERQLQQAKHNLADAEESLKKTEQNTGMIQLDSQARALIESAATLRAQIAAKEVQIEAMQTYENGQNADLVQAKQELAGLQEQLAKLGGTEGDDGGLIMPRGAVPEAGLEYIRKVRDVKYYETIFDILARQFELAKLDEAREGALIQVVDSAIPPDKRSFPKRGTFVIVGCVVGFFVAVMAVVLRYSWQLMEADPRAYAKIARLSRSIFWRVGQRSMVKS